MAEGGEMRGFVFSVVFIIVFSGLLATIPAGLQGNEDTVSTVLPIDPSLVTGFAESWNYTRAEFSFGSYEYDLDSRKWVILTDDLLITLSAKILTWGFIWLGQINPCNFISPDGENRGYEPTLATIESDAEDGAVRYALEFTLGSADSAGSLVVYWNTTLYPDIHDAWDNDEVYLLHGIGIDASATNNIAEILVGLLFLSLPDVPVLVNLFLAVPVWACVVFVLWFVIKEMIP
ncbi:unnamed protein product, partial [marine sediment metagenome]